MRHLIKLNSYLLQVLKGLAQMWEIHFCCSDNLLNLVRQYIPYLQSDYSTGHWNKFGTSQNTVQFLNSLIIHHVSTKENMNVTMFGHQILISN